MPGNSFLYRICQKKTLLKSVLLSEWLREDMIKFTAIHHRPIDIRNEGFFLQETEKVSINFTFNVELWATSKTNKEN